MLALYFFKTKTALSVKNNKNFLLAIHLEPLWLIGLTGQTIIVKITFHVLNFLILGGQFSLSLVSSWKYPNEEYTTEIQSCKKQILIFNVVLHRRKILLGDNGW